MIVKREDFVMSRPVSGLSLRVDGETLAVEIESEGDVLDETDLRWLLFAAGSCALRYLAEVEDGA